jgi:ABC-type transport system involved in multi-copper enzyme maturation permease subunit
MRLLQAELLKFRRPLLPWVVVAIVGFMALTAWGQVHDAATQYQFSQQQPDQGVMIGQPTCTDLGLPEGQQCEAAKQAAKQQQLAEMRQSMQESLAQSALQGRRMQHPLAIGALVAGMLASVPGALVLLLLAAGHVGNEWSGHTIKQVLTQEGRRWRVLTAKLASLWLVAAGLLLLTWTALALLSFVFRTYKVGGSAMSTQAAWRLAGPLVGRSLLVLAAFVVIGVLASLVTRNTLGGVFLGFAFVIGSLVLGNLAFMTRGTLSYWVAGWMGFRVDVEGSPPVPYLWTGSFPQKVPHPSHQAGLYDLAGLLVVGVTLALVRMVRSDVKA